MFEKIKEKALIKAVNTIEKELKQIYEVCDGEKTNYKIIPLIMENRVIKKIKKL